MELLAHHVGPRAGEANGMGKSAEPPGAPRPGCKDVEANAAYSGYLGWCCLVAKAKLKAEERAKPNDQTF